MAIAVAFLPRQRLFPSVAALVVVAVSVSPLAVSLNDSLASGLQATTDEAAVKAKHRLCIAINRGTEVSGLKETFFAFYDGTMVSARQMHPNQFRPGRVGPLPPFKVQQVTGPKEMLASIDSKFFKLSGIETDDVADDQVLRLDTFFVVGETETYDTVIGGTNTVFVLRPAGKESMGDVKATHVFPWYDRRDNVVIVGEFLGIEGANAIFHADGGETTVPLGKFTRGDRELMRILADRYPQKTPPQEGSASPPQKPAPKPVGLD